MSNVMNWPKDDNWACETCGEKWELRWRIPHGQCECRTCGTIYSMGHIGNMKSRPLNAMKSAEAVRIVWNKTGENVMNAPDEVWADAYAEAKHEKTSEGEPQEQDA